MPTGTVRLHRVLRAPPERVYRAFLDSAAMAKWLPPHGFTCTVDQLEAKVGGTFRMAFKNFGSGSGNGHAFGGTDLSIVQEGIHAVIPVEMCYLGWQDSLAQLANLVEPEIPG